ncbi:MAG TPA: type Z 30S ribosomal protein S14 [Elusimicrobiales bacterium]|nr:MAG: small subunit ribosomal protein S14 [Elusimicrobiota bacterium]MDQ7773681.1 type Z 30S ribosomal protein S14 [Elusimicrobiales bacterium]KAF0157504.1 MAG: small subunit ribosomal protein S14 [Elusimicrobiota bacterium]MDT8285556.1 type Z 30S ribosomal protein S14 [Elusimicrobiales bacterium]HBE88564.1 type Z 30S ribosomal protein S14 [Elusimicrobiota bacterium]
MATYAWMAKMRKPQKFSTRFRNRCQVCGRPRAYYRDFGLCRICLRKMAHEGLIPGLRKSSW